MGSTGVVRSIEGGVLCVSGLEAVALGERIEIGESVGVVMRLEEEQVRVALLDSPANILVGATVRASKEPFSVVAGSALLGRALNGSGRPIDNKGPLLGNPRPISPKATPMLTRGKERILTSVMALDVMLSIERGGHMILQGPHRSGKSSLAAQIIKAQRDQKTCCVYVCASSSPEPDLERLQESLEHTTIIVADPSIPNQRVFAPLIGLAIAEEFRAQGKGVLLVFDDLKRCCTAYRELLSLLGFTPSKATVEPMSFSWLGALWGDIGVRPSGGSLSEISIVTDEGPRIPMPGDLLPGFDPIVRLAPPSFQWRGPSIDIMESLGGLCYGFPSGARWLRNQAKFSLDSIQEYQRLSEKSKDPLQKKALQRAMIPGLQLRELFRVTTTHSLAPELQLILLFAIVKGYTQMWSPSSMEVFVQKVKERLQSDPPAPQVLESARTWKLMHMEKSRSLMEQWVSTLPPPSN